MSHAAVGIAIYDEALSKTSFDADRTILIDGQREAGLHWNGRPICSVLRPLLLDWEETERRETAAKLVARAIGIAAARAAADPVVRARLYLNEEEEAYVRLGGGDVGELLARLDGFVDTSGSLKFIEYNPFASGFAFADGVAQRFEATTAFQACTRRLAIERPRLLSLFISNLLGQLRDRSRSGAVRVGIALPPTFDSDLEDVPETAVLFSALAAEAIEVYPTTLEALVFRDDRVEVGGQRLDALVIEGWEALLVPTGRSFSLWKAVRDGLIAVLNPVASATLRGTKALFGILSDPDFEDLFPDPVRDALVAHVPWTRYMVPGETTYEGRRVDLLNHVRARRDTLVLKPANGFGGNGVILGWQTAEMEWDRAIDMALGSGYVVQERVASDPQMFPVAAGDAFELRPFFVDYNPFVWGGSEVSGALSRLCDQPIMNIQAGLSSLVPVYSAKEPS